MKKFISLLCIFALLFGAPSALAELTFDLSSLSFQELLLLQETVAKELTTRSEWKEVAVPPGAYEIGVDIPAGYWDITIQDKAWGSTIVTYCEELDESKTDYKNGTYIASAVVCYDHLTWSVNLTAGNWLIIDDETVIFTPHTRPALGF